MHTITWLHLSDLHFQKNDEYNRGVVLDALWKDISERVNCINSDLGKLDFICVTGDIAYHGKTEEYELAIEQFFQHLLTHTGLDWEKLFVVPGNHDIVQSAVTPGAKSIGDALKTRDQITKLMSTPRDRELIFDRLQEYFDFFQKHFQPLSLNEEFGSFYNAFPPVTTEKKVAIIGLNSAWLSCGSKEDRGKLAVGEIQVDKALKQAKTADIRLCLMHHPFEWLNNNDDRRSVEFLLRKECHFLLRGHLHQPNVLQESTLEGETVIIPAGAVYDKRESPLNYNFVCLNLATSTGVVYLRRYNDERREWVRDIHSTGDKLDGQITFDLPKVLKNSARNSEPQIPAISVSPSHTIKQTDRPESLVNQTIQLLQENKIIGIAELLKKQLNAFRQDWEDVYSQWAHQQDKVKEAYEKLETTAERFEAIGLVCIEHQSEEMYQRLLEIFEAMIRPVGWRSGSEELLSIPFATVYRLFYTWGAQCIACENFDFLRLMFSCQCLYRNDYLRLVDIRRVFHPKVHGESTRKAFDHVREKMAAQDYLQESFPNLARDSLYFLCQLDLICCFRAQKENKEGKKDIYPKFPNFGRFSFWNVEPLRLKILKNPNFAEKVAQQLFNETWEYFLANADERLDNLCQIIEKTPFSWDSIRRFTEPDS